jgi:hypothetical protein
MSAVYSALCPSLTPAAQALAVNGTNVAAILTHPAPYRELRAALSSLRVERMPQSVKDRVTLLCSKLGLAPDAIWVLRAEGGDSSTPASEAPAPAPQDEAPATGPGNQSVSATERAAQALREIQPHSQDDPLSSGVRAVVGSQPSGALFTTTLPIVPPSPPSPFEETSNLGMVASREVLAAKMDSLLSLVRALEPELAVLRGGPPGTTQAVPNPVGQAPPGAPAPAVSFSPAVVDISGGETPSRRKKRRRAKARAAASAAASESDVSTPDDSEDPPDDVLSRVDKVGGDVLFDLGTVTHLGGRVCQGAPSSN